MRERETQTTYIRKGRKKKKKKEKEQRARETTFYSTNSTENKTFNSRHNIVRVVR
jgi:hypothetical protein